LTNRYQSLIRLGQLLGNPQLEQLCVPGAYFVAAGSKNDSEWDSGLSLLSVDALDDLFSNRPLVIEDEEALVQRILSLGPEYSILLRHVSFSSLTPAGQLTLMNVFEEETFVDWVWVSVQALIDRNHTSKIKKESRVENRRFMRGRGRGRGRGPRAPMEFPRAPREVPRDDQDAEIVQFSSNSPANFDRSFRKRRV
jgi:hypothetical protein